MSNLISSPARAPISTKLLIQYILVMAFILLFSVLLFTFFHESGHTVIGLLFGAKITSFSVDFIGMSAHVGLDASFNPVQQGLVSIGGFFLPLLLTLIFLVSVPRRGNALLEWVKLLTAIVSISALLAWVVLPWIYLSGGRPGDDSITFITATSINPALVSAGAAVIFTVSLLIFLYRVEGSKGVLIRFRALPAELITPAARRTLAGMVVIFILIAGLAFGLGAVYGTGQSNFLTPPAGYTPAATIQLSNHALAGEPVYNFALVKPANVSLFFAMDGLTRGPGAISLVGPGGYENIFYTGDEKAGGNFTVHPQNLKLAAGQYQVVLFFPKDPGVLKISQKIDPIDSLQIPGK